MYAVGRCKIRDWRDKLSMSQSELSRLSGVSRPSISAYENELSKPDLRSAKNISYVLGCNIEDLYEWDFIIPPVSE